MINDNFFAAGLERFVVVVLFILLMIYIFVNLMWPKELPYNNTILNSPKPIIPELQITGNGTEIDTIHIYKLEE